MHHRRFALVVVFLSSGAAAAFACGGASSDTAPSSDASLLDSAAPTLDGAQSSEASPTLDGAHPSEASLEDASDAGDLGDGSGLGDDGDASDANDANDATDATDATPAFDAGPPGLITVIVKNRNGVLESGVTIVFQDDTGAVTGSATTDANGSATEIASDGQVTALFGTAARPALVTIVGVRPGDVLNMSDTTSGANTYGFATVSALPASPPAATTGYVVNAGDCDQGFAMPPSPSFEIFSGLGRPCVSGGKFPLIVTANDVDSNPIAFTFQKDNSFVPDGGAFATLSGAWSPFGSIALGATNAPSGSLQYDSYEVVGGVEVELPGLPVSDGGAAIVALSHPGYADFVQAQLDVILDGGRAGEEIATRITSPGATGSVSFDLSTMPPIVQSTTLTTADPTRPVFGWTIAASPAPSVGTMATMAWQTGTLIGTWLVVVPSSTTSFQFPALPADAGTWRPASASDFLERGLTIVSADNLQSYAAARASMQTMFAGYELALFDTLPFLPSNGSVRVSTWFE